jgi:long-chain acyl-CoA synthetase
MSTIPQLFVARMRHAPDVVACYAPLPDTADDPFLLEPACPADGLPEGWGQATYRQLESHVCALAQRLESLGVVRGTPVAILAETSGRWSAVDLALQCLGAITVGIYPTLLAEAVCYQLEHSEAELLVLEDAVQYARIRDSLEALPKLRHTLSLLPDAGVPQLTPARPDPAFLDERVARVQPADVATYIYTSGTTGNPKAVVLTHANFVSIIEASKEIAPSEPGDRSIVFLPLAHVLQRFALYRGLTEDVVGFYAPSIHTLPETIAVARPHMLATVPRMLEKIRAKVEAKATSKSPRARAVLDWAIDIGLQWNRTIEAGGTPGFKLRMQHRIADRLVFQKIRNGLGGHLRLFVSGGAALSPEVGEWFQAVGILVREGWGLSETSAPATGNRLDDYRFGTVGKPLKGTEIKLAEDGEVLVRGPGVFREYLKDPEATAAAFTDDGFFRTGDIGLIDDDGFLSIIDRKKEIIVTSGGKNIPPVNIEQRIEGGLVGHAVVVGNERPFLTALIAPDPDALAAEAQSRGWTGTYAEWAARSEVHDAIEARVAAANAQLARFETVKRFAILPAPLTVETGELTPTMKLKRRVIAQRYADQIDALYA